MKFLYILCFLLFFLAPTGYAQTDWEIKEKLLWESFGQGKISSEEWYQSKMEEAGSLGGNLQVWIKEDKEATNNFLKNNGIIKSNGLKLIIPDEWEVVMENGNTYIKLFLLNLESEVVKIPRIDSTVDNFSDFLKVEGTWYPLRKNSKSSCGNSYFTSALKPNNYYYLEVSSIHQSNGSQEMMYKVAFDYQGERFESNEINVKLFTNQIKRLVEEGMN